MEAQASNDPNSVDASEVLLAQHLIHQIFDQHFVPYLCHLHLVSVPFLSSTHHFPSFLFHILPDEDVVNKITCLKKFKLYVHCHHFYFESTGPRLVNVKLVLHCECRRFFSFFFLFGKLW